MLWSTIHYFIVLFMYVSLVLCGIPSLQPRVSGAKVTTAEQISD